MPNIAVIDIDGIIANSDARFARATTNGRIDWRIAFDPALVDFDTLIEDAASSLDAIEAQGYSIVFLTSRPESMEVATIAWLQRHAVLASARTLKMKPASKQYVKTKVWKAEEVVALLAEYRPVSAIFVDDEQSNIDEVRSVVNDPLLHCYISFATMQA